MRINLSSGYFYGNVLERVLATDLTLTETSYAPALKLPAHNHESAYFCFVLEGGFSETYGKHSSRSCRKSTLVFHPAGETHSDRFYTDTRCFNIQMNSQWFERALGHSRIINSPADFYDERLSNLATRLYREFREFDDFSALAIEGLMFEMMAEASRHSAGKFAPRPPRWLRQAREILDERFDESLTLSALSESVGIHPVHLAREFRRFYRCTVGEYVRKLRIDYACRRLLNSDASLAEVALAAGFFDQSHFARNFKSRIGMTPHEYRKVWKSR